MNYRQLKNLSRTVPGVLLALFSLLFTSKKALACDPSTSTCLFSYKVGIGHIGYFSNSTLDIPAVPVTRVIIGIEGNERNALGLFKTLYKAASEEKQLATTLIVVPWIKGNDYGGSTSCTDGDCDPVSAGEFYWTTEGWKQGDYSISTDTGVKISSFQMIDQIIRTAIDPRLFSSLSSIVVTGHSAGGQFVQRFAIGTSIEQILPGSVQLSYIVANPSSYLYLDPARPTWAGLYTQSGMYPTFGLNAPVVSKPNFLDPYNRSVSPYKELPEFSTIRSGLNSSGSDCQCAGDPPCSYERFKYGFDFEPLDSNHYMCSNNSYQKCSNIQTTDEKVAAFLGKKVTYILGQLDNSTPSGIGTHDLDTSCSGNFQGADRLSRGTFFYESLSRFGSHSHRLLFAAQVGHDSSDLFATYTARRALFDGDLPVKQYIAPNYTLKQLASARFLDASTSSPYGGVTGTSQTDLTQDWILTKVGANEYRIQQQKTLRYLEASPTGYTAYTKEYRSSSDQIWILTPVPNQVDTYTIQQKSTLRYLDADTSSKYQVKTQPLQSDGTQSWIVKTR